MDDPIPTSANDSSFDAFQTATASPNNAGSFDAFGDMQSSEPPKSSSFDAFGDMPSSTPRVFQQQKQQSQFDAFHSSAPVVTSMGGSGSTFDAFGNNNVNDMFGNMSMNNLPMNTMGSSKNIMGGGKGRKTNDDDGFGDFSDGNANKNKSSDPLKNLISLDGLTKNAKKENRESEPIIFNQAAKNYVENKDQLHVGASKMSVDMAFSGVDGLHKMHNHSQTMMMQSNNHQGKTSVMNSSNNNMMMNSGMNSGMNMGMNGMYSNQSGMNMGMMQGNNMNSNNVSMNSMMGGMGGNNQGSMMGGMMSGQQGNNMMMGGLSNNNMMGSQQGNNMMGGMGGQQRNNNMMGGMGGQQSFNLNMMGGQPMGGGGF